MKLHLMPEGRECTLRIEMPDGAGVPVSARLYRASSDESFALRVASRPLDITVGPRDRVRAKASLKRDDYARLDEISAFALLMSSKPDTSVAIQVNVDGSDLDLGAIRMTGTRQTETWDWIALGTGIARAIATDAGRDPGEFRIGDVQDAAGELQILAALASDRIIRVDFTPKPDAPRKFDGFLAYCSATIGDHVFSAVAYRPLSMDEIHDGRRRVMFGPGRTVWSRMSRRDGWSDEPMLNAYRQQLDRLTAGAEIMAMGNLAEMVGAGFGDVILKSDLPAGQRRDFQHSSRGTGLPRSRRTPPPRTTVRKTK